MPEFQDQFTQVTRQFNHLTPGAILNDFVQLMCVLLSSPFFHNNLFKQAISGSIYSDSRFGKSLNEQGQEHPADYAEMMNELTRTYLTEVFSSEPFADILGAVYEQHSINIRKGQFFTPSSLATLLAEMHIDDANQHFQGETSLSINDSSCGAGALLLAKLRKFHDAGGAKAIGSVEVYANDIDLNLCRITTVQILISSALKKLPLRRFQISNYDILKDLFNEECGNKVVYDWQYQGQQTEAMNENA
ncbi:N-6 DNA methylase [Methylophilus luteus]|uniref:N-6 DNA methylase n=1 Tax=Methylophilus luteus TaxID=640108 RepID=A0ABW3F7M6_9PROT